MKHFIQIADFLSQKFNLNLFDEKFENFPKLLYLERIFDSNETLDLGDFLF
jgi:hypothetical protein